MAKISVRVNLVYTNKKTLQSTYNIEWKSDKRDFEGFMLDLMNTLVSLEPVNTFEKVDIIGIDVIEASKKEKDEIAEFKKANDIK